MRYAAKIAIRHLLSSPGQTVLLRLTDNAPVRAFDAAGRLDAARAIEFLARSSLEIAP